MHPGAFLAQGLLGCALAVVVCRCRAAVFLVGGVDGRGVIGGGFKDLAAGFGHCEEGGLGGGSAYEGRGGGGGGVFEFRYIRKTGESAKFVRVLLLFDAFSSVTTASGGVGGGSAGFCGCGCGFAGVGGTPDWVTC